MGRVDNSAVVLIRLGFQMVSRNRVDIISVPNDFLYFSVSQALHQVMFGHVFLNWNKDVNLGSRSAANLAC